MSSGSLIFIKNFSFVSELYGTDFFYKYNLNSQIWCLPVCAGEDSGLFCAGNLTSKKFRLCRPSNKQTNRIVQSSNLRKINNSSKNVSIFRNLDVFLNLKRNFDFDVIREKLCLRTKMSWFWPAGLRIMYLTIICEYYLWQQLNYIIPSVMLTTEIMYIFN